ncbi:MAG: N-acetylmuramoyl-L-alanine amidase [Bdellovibrionales bacterium]|nr:N-acetylmuramoyl-L-alanine amidase [Bdellovibrionales bacterium]
MHHSLRIFFFLFLLVPLAGQCAPQGKGAYDELRAKYLTLRNTDTDVTRLDEWTSLANGMLGYVSRYPNSENAASLLYDASIVYEKLYQAQGDKELALRATTLLDRIARDYPGHMLADDALVRRGDLSLYVLDEVDAAKRSYQEVVGAYKDTDMFPIAQLRLSDLKSGAYLLRHEQPEADRVKRTGAPMIVIDPGHGGEDFGAVGHAGLMEKDVTLSVALELEKLLVKDLGATVRLTRRKDVFVPLMERTQLANDYEADLFVSLHGNASPKGKLSGLEVYYLDNKGDRSSKALAERENSSVRFEGPQGDLQYMLSDLIQNGKVEESIAFANHVHASLLSTLAPKWKHLKGLGVKQAPFYVLVGAHMPCVLVEMFFMNHAQDGKLLADGAFRKNLAKGIAQGIAQTLKEYEA